MTRPSTVHERPRRGVTDEWYTPPEVFTALGLDFDLDPCHPRDRLAWVPALRTLSIDDNGLAVPWQGRVWLNPPYGPQTGLWLGKLADHGDGVALVFARTDTRWFQSCAARAQVVCMVEGRIRFVQPNGQRAGTAGAPSCLLAYGDECADAVSSCGLGLTFEARSTP